MQKRENACRKYFGGECICVTCEMFRSKAVNGKPCCLVHHRQCSYGNQKTVPECDGFIKRKGVV